jgi:stage IV sporulation protein B
LKFIESQKKKLFIFLFVCFSVMFVSYVRTSFLVPGTITLLEGQEYIYDFKSPFMVNITADREGVVKLNDGEVTASGNNFNLSSPIAFRSQKDGSVNLKMKLYGLIPLKTMRVDIVPNKKIIACGNTIGVKLKLDGILVIGLSDVETTEGMKAFPAKNGGIKPGDFLLEINKVRLNSIDDLIKAVDLSQGENINIKYKRGDTYGNAIVKPVKEIDDKKYHLGLWVRDSTAGIGTLTFYDPDTKSFGALGHAITDIDTGEIMPVGTGEILESNILAVRKGRQGNPGELKGVFLEDRNKYGFIKKNCQYGIYGIMNNSAIESAPKRLYPIALRSQVKEGPATILANVDGKKVEEYSIEIQKVFKQNYSGTKGMIVKITDKRLLDITGGIVQGMSGSPIIQNGKIAGAVTHVLVNDPTRGYGIFIEWMIKNTPENSLMDVEMAS